MLRDVFGMLLFIEEVLENISANDMDSDTAGASKGGGVVGMLWYWGNQI
jgi:hypothetical protein